MFRSSRRALLAPKGKVRTPAARQRTILRLGSLEERVVPTTDIILDFDGGTLQAGQGYLFQQGFSETGGDTYQPWTGFTSTNPPSAFVREEQIQQIVAGVREDYADFDVRVIRDDLGVNSPFYDGADTVCMVVGDHNAGLFGIASSVDLNQTNRDVAFIFGPTHENLFPNTTYRSIREIIDTCSHEAGHTLGLSHTSESDTEMRQIVTTAPQDTDLDSRFSTEALNHAGPETGIIYAERARLFQNVGAAPAGTTLGSSETVTGQTLPADTFNTDVLSTTALVTINGTINFFGDRDAYRITVGPAGTYMVRERALPGSGLAPVITVWNENGDFVAVGTVGTTASSVTFTAQSGETFYILAGTSYDLAPSGTIGTPSIGDYIIEFGPVPPEQPPNPLFGTLVATEDAGGTPIVRLLDLHTFQVIREFFAYDPQFRGGVRAVLADVNFDGVDDIITAPGEGGGPHIKVFDGRNFQPLLSPLGSFLAYDVNFRGGVYVAAGDVNGDGYADIITGAGIGGGPHVRIFSGRDGSIISEFMAFDSNFRGGVTVAAGDFNADGLADVVAGAGRGGGPHVKVFNIHNGLLLLNLFAYDVNFHGGVFVSAGDVDGDGRSDLITGAGAGGGSHIRVFNALGGFSMGSFFAFSNTFGSAQYVGNSNYNGGVRIFSRDFDNDGNDEIVAVPGMGGNPTARFFTGDGDALGSVNLFDSRFQGGLFVG